MKIIYYTLIPLLFVSLVQHLMWFYIKHRTVLVCMRFKKHLEIVNYKLSAIIPGLFKKKCVNNFLNWFSVTKCITKKMKKSKNFTLQ